MVTLSIRLSDKLYAKLKKRAQENDRSMNREVARLIRLELEEKEVRESEEARE